MCRPLDLPPRLSSHEGIGNLAIKHALHRSMASAASASELGKRRSIQKRSLLAYVLSRVFRIKLGCIGPYCVNPDIKIEPEAFQMLFFSRVGHCEPIPFRFVARHPAQQAKQHSTTNPGK